MLIRPGLFCERKKNVSKASGLDIENVRKLLMNEISDLISGGVCLAAEKE